MNINVRSLSDLSESELDEMRATLAWMLDGSSEQWSDDHWCVTFENSAVTLSFLVQQGAEPLAVPDAAAN
ncbi:MAG TPA: hypothetical protein VI547_03605 [Anaerolineales bacterium]|nr:hypothetical protein [Anaerolineales bacterium]